MDKTETVDGNPTAVSDEEALERSIEETLASSEVQQQFRASISMAPGDIQLVPPVRVSRKRSFLFFKNTVKLF